MSDDIANAPQAEKPCAKCGETRFGVWHSSSSGRRHRYCKPCRDRRRLEYDTRKALNGGSHTRAQWLAKLATYERCPRCGRAWGDIPLRPDRRYRYPWTKDHIVALRPGGTDDIENLQPLCYQCNFSKNVGP